jgi:prepilin-type N-terminal cleavage/methylation domain-containing protein
MTRQGGFTLIEIMIVIAILGILGATAIPTYRTWQQRGMSAEARVMARQILDAEIAYYLDNPNNKYFPPEDSPIQIWSDDKAKSGNVLRVSQELHVDIPTGHFLDYTISVFRENNNETVMLSIMSSKFLPIFGDTDVKVYYLDKSGKISDRMTP